MSQAEALIARARPRPPSASAALRPKELSGDEDRCGGEDRGEAERGGRTVGRRRTTSVPARQLNDGCAAQTTRLSEVPRRSSPTQGAPARKGKAAGFTGFAFNEHASTYIPVHVSMSACLCVSDCLIVCLSVRLFVCMSGCARRSADMCSLSQMFRRRATEACERR